MKHFIHIIFKKQFLLFLSNNFSNNFYHPYKIEAQIKYFCNYYVHFPKIINTFKSKPVLWRAFIKRAV